MLHDDERSGYERKLELLTVSAIKDGFGASFDTPSAQNDAIKHRLPSV